MNPIPKSYKRISTCATCEHIWYWGIIGPIPYCCVIPGSREEGNRLHEDLLNRPIGWSGFSDWATCRRVNLDGCCDEYKEKQHDK